MSDDPNPFVISGLIQKRAEVPGEVAKARIALERAIADLQAIDRALDLMWATRRRQRRSLGRPVAGRWKWRPQKPCVRSSDAP